MAGSEEDAMHGAFRLRSRSVSIAFCSVLAFNSFKRLNYRYRIWERPRASLLSRLTGA